MKERDYFRCFCGGTLSQVGKTRKGRKLYKCGKCDGGKIVECAICQRPKTMWADDGSICTQCFLDWTKKKIYLSEEEIAGIMKWAVIVTKELHADHVNL